MCPIAQSRKRRTIDYELDDLYSADHEYHDIELTDDFIEAYYDEKDQRQIRMNRTEPIDSHFTGAMRVLNGETGTLPFFVAIRTSTNIHFCGGACKLNFTDFFTKKLSI